MDDLELAATLAVILMVAQHEAYYPMLDKDVALATIYRIEVTGPEQLGRTSRLAAKKLQEGLVPRKGDVCKYSPGSTSLLYLLPLCGWAKALLGLLHLAVDPLAVGGPLP